MSCHTAVIIGCKRIFLYIERQFLFFSRFQAFRLAESRQYPRRFPQLSLRRARIHQHDLFACTFSCIIYFHPDKPAVLLLLHTARHSKRSVRESESERIQHLVLSRVKCLEITVSHINIFRVLIPVRAAEMRRRRVILHRPGNRIGQSAAGIHPAHEHIRHRMSALHAALPCIEHRLRRIGFHPFHVNDIAHIEHDNHPLERAAHVRKHLLLPFREVITASFGCGVTILPRRAPDNDQRGIALRRRCLHDLTSQRHFRLAPRFLCPSFSHVKRVIRQPVPVDLLQFLIQYKLLFLQGIRNPHHVTGVDHAAGACTTLVIVKLNPSEYGQLLPFPQRKRIPVIFQKNGALRRCLSCLPCIRIPVDCIFVSHSNLLYSLTAAQRRRAAVSLRLQYYRRVPAGSSQQTLPFRICRRDLSILIIIHFIVFANLSYHFIRILHHRLPFRTCPAGIKTGCVAAALTYPVRYCPFLLKRNYTAVICIIDILRNRLGLQHVYQRLDSVAVLIAFLHRDHIHVSLGRFGIGLLISHRVFAH